LLLARHPVFSRQALLLIFSIVHAYADQKTKKKPPEKPGGQS
jgi:hypothetical protein